MSAEPVMPPLRTHPISSLRPDMKESWMIKAKVVLKSETHPSLNGAGVLFTIHLADESETIVATASGDCSLFSSLFFNMIELFKVYYISGCDVKENNKDNKLSNKPKCELTFTSQTRIIRERREDLVISNVTFNFPSLQPVLDPIRGGSAPSGDLEEIAHLWPVQYEWAGVIKARVTDKTEDRESCTTRGQCTRFSMTLTDESGEIRVVAFNEACDMFINRIQLGNVYYFSRCKLKYRPEGNNFCTHINDCEMEIMKDTQVVLCEEDCVSIPHVMFSFVPLRSLTELRTDTIVDIIGVCWPEEVHFETGTDVLEIFLVDQSCKPVTVVLFGDPAKEFNDLIRGSSNPPPIMAIKGCRRDFNFYKQRHEVTLRQSATLQLNPGFRQAAVLREWYDNGGAATLTPVMQVMETE